MNFIYYNPNPNAKTFKSGKPKSWNIQDDVVRAISKAIDKSWIETYELLDEIAKSNYTTINDKQVVNELLHNQLNYTYVTFGKPKPGCKRPIINDFSGEYGNGIYVLYLRDYYAVVIDGILYNTIDLNDKPVYSYWKIDNNDLQKCIK